MADIYPVSVSLSYTKAIVKRGKSVQVDAGVVYSNGKKDNRLTYSQSGTGYVSFVAIKSSDISRIAITMLAYVKGKVDLLVKSEVDPSVCNVCSVDIVEGGSASTEERPVVGLMITGSLQLEVGDKGVIKDLIFPINASNRKLKYVCSDTSVATVDSKGNVTAVSNGKASIVVTTVDGNYSLICDVTVGKQEKLVVTGVELSNYNLVLAKGDVAQVKATVLSDGKGDTAGVYCSTSNETVASLANPVNHLVGTNQSLITVKANAVGSAKFSVRSVTDLTKYAILNVTVVQSGQNVYTPIKQVEAIPKTISVPVNTEFEITGRALLDIPGSNLNRYSGDVSFSSSNSSVAEIVKTYSDSTTINRCTIKSGSSIGQATITVTSNSDASKKATCKVYVGQAVPDDDGTIPNPVKSVSLNKRQIELAVGDYYQLNATVAGKFTDRAITNPTVLWSSNNNNVFVNDFGRVLAVKIGSSVVTATSQENTSLYDYCIVNVRERTDDDGPIVTPDDEESNGTDTIIRIDYNENGTFDYTKLFEGNLGFDLKHPIESVVYHETEDIQKIYWVDGKNVLRFMNFMEKSDETTGLYPWQFSSNSYDNTYFDSNRAIDFGVDVKITKDNSGNTRPNGVIQYLLTYYNKHGQESGYAWISDLIYLSPVASGGAADGTNNNSITLRVSGLDTKFSYFRIYSVFRSSLNGTTVSYIVFDGKTDGGSAIVIDNNSHLVSVDSSQLLYLGSQHVVASTLTHKDQTLFLGDLSSVDRDYNDVESVIKKSMIGPYGLSNCIDFEYDEDEIPNEAGDGNYSYNSQLVKSSSEITSFKGGEKYRFGIVFHKKDGTLTDAFWIGDKVNRKYPQMSDTGIKRIIAKCILPPDVVAKIKEKGYSTAQLMIAEATYADRSIKAQGIVCPTVFNVWNRFMNRLYSASSWMMRPRNAEYAWKHFEPIHKSTSSTGEIDCNYWETDDSPNPYYILKNYATAPEYGEEFDGRGDYPNCILLYCIRRTTGPFANYYHALAFFIFVKGSLDTFSPASYEFTGKVKSTIEAMASNGFADEQIVSENGVTVKIHKTGYYDGEGGNVSVRIRDVYNKITKAIRDEYSFFGDGMIAEFSTFYDWCDDDIIPLNTNIYFNNRISGKHYDSIGEAINDMSGGNAEARWIVLGENGSSANSIDYIPSYYKRHLTFIDENVVTLNSPEIEYEAVSFDKIESHRFRIVGVARIDGQYSDYTVDATPGKLSGENLVKEHFTNTLISWPLWKEFGLDERKTKPDVTSGNDYEYEDFDDDPRDRDSIDYIWGGSLVKYWLHMWNHSGKINGYTDYEENDYSTLTKKVFANARYSNKTTYYAYNNGWDCDPDSIRIFNYTSSQYVGIDIGKKNTVQRYYDGILNESLSLPQNHKYPVLYEIGTPNPSEILDGIAEPYLYLSDPVSITYASTPHAVIALPTSSSENGYTQTILPRLESNSNEIVYIGARVRSDTGALLPWIDNTSSESYPYKDYSVIQDTIANPGISDDAQYVYIGEIYSDLPDYDEIRYGGTSDAAIQNNRFIIAGPQYEVSSMTGMIDIMIANQGDTYIQRWDCLKTRPYSSDCVNNVIDITSVMLETHINIDGRTDLQRGTSYIASLDTEKWGNLNPVYSQQNNFIAQRDLDEDFNLDAYRSSITWTLEKHDSADVDEWTHITLANTLKLDGDKGVCQALRRFGNSIIAFQDRGISEVLFNSRTQLSTQDGVPVEIANSGKVDGKRYITNKFGCTNKWSIIEGKSALYFVDNVNKAFCAFTGQGIDPLSDKLGFGTWFRRNNVTEAWTPADFNNIVSFYDKVHSDVYLVKKNDSENQPCLVYNEALGTFTSFFDYASVPMMTNVNDKFVSFKNHKLWLQNEGMYCNFFGKQYDYWVQYRVTPEPFSDKIWTNIDYRADFYEVLNSGADPYVPEEKLINGDVYSFNSDLYKEWETFTDYRVWDEYQDTGSVPFTHEKFDRDDVRKKFRIWRLTIPRALKEGTNKHGLDRIRNPWINLLFRKESVDGKYLMQLHDIVVKYFE